MKQLIQNLKSGDVTFIDVPVPRVRERALLVESLVSLISTGTERMLLEFGRSSLLEKARKQPERLKRVIKKIKTDGLFTTLELVKAKLSEPIPLGYCNVGVVREVGSNVVGFSSGDRVVSNGPHAELVVVPQTLCAKVPDNVDDEAAVFAVPASIALEGIRLLNPSLGEYVVVIGLGLIGQLAVQLLVASGCRVLGIDLNEEKARLAEEFGAECLVIKPGESPVERAFSFSKGRGVDGVLITAATRSNEPIEHAAQMCRKRGKIVLVGVTGMNVPRDLFYEKELTFKVSSSYGPGRYDPLYESGIDYPYGYVRWTAQRNFEAALEMMAQGLLDTEPLITHRIAFERAPEAYELLLKESPLGILLKYEGKVDLSAKTVEFKKREHREPEDPVIGFIGVGNFAKLVLLPALRKTSFARLKTIASAGGISGAISAKRFNFERATSDYQEVHDDPEINTIFIATRHSSHAELAAEALRKDKNVFVEKPLSTDIKGLVNVIRAHETATGKILMVGFNRRFSPFIRRIKQAVSMRSDPICLSMTVNAGFIPSTHWIHDEGIGGGRVIGEACHFIDLFRFLVGAPIAEVYAATTRRHSQRDDDKVAITLKFEDGSIGVVNYFANGNKAYPKERLEVFFEEKVIVLDNFRKLKGYGLKLEMKSLKQDKGHSEEVRKFIRAVKEGMPSPIPFDELVEVTLATLAVVKSMKEGEPVKMSKMREELERAISKSES